MSKSKKSTEKVRFINPPNKLKMKVGTGGIDEALLDKSQNFIETSKFDFVPFAKKFLGDLNKGIKKIESKSADFTDIKNELIAPIMQLKANGGMFRYQLVSEVADIALQFLEAIDRINEDSLVVLKAHETSLNMIINNELTGNGGREGNALVKELDRACRRYFSKHKNPDK